MTLGQDQHSHPHGPRQASPVDGGPDRKKKMAWAIGVTSAILVLEAVGGVWSGSLALLSDAGHMLTDLAALLISLTAMILAERPASPTHTFGLARLEVLAALGNALTFFLMVAAVAWQAGDRLLHPALPDWRAMGAIAGVGFLANAANAGLLHGAHQEDLNLRGAWLHVMGDLASSLGVLVGVVLIARTGWSWVDPVLSLLIALLIAGSALRLFRKALRILLESSPRGLSAEDISQSLREGLPEIQEVHHVHLWEVGAGQVYLTAHLVVTDRTIGDGMALLGRAQALLKEKLQIDHSTFQLEVHVSPRVPLSEKSRP